jgi:hypothetical protein
MRQRKIPIYRLAVFEPNGYKLVSSSVLLHHPIQLKYTCVAARFSLLTTQCFGWLDITGNPNPEPEKGNRKGEEGVVSAVMYTSHQVGTTVGLAIVASITLGVNSKLAAGDGDVNEFVGYAASFWSLLGLNGAMILITLLFVRN